MIEVISREYEMQFKTNPQTGEYILEPHGSRMWRAKEPVREITFENIERMLNGKRAFIDVFRFSEKIYGSKVNIEAADLSWEVSNHSDSYKKHLRRLAMYESLIPVISVKKEFEFSETELKALVAEVKEQNGVLALRLTEEYLELCRSSIESILDERDYILFDIGEQRPDTKFLEIEDVLEMDTDAQCILLNSPRKRSVSNGAYPEADITDLICDNAREVAQMKQMAGYGDYCGLKDVMPEIKGGNGSGCALALMYQFEEQGFYAFSNHNTELGPRGYPEIIDRIMDMEEVLDADADCPAFRRIGELPGGGTYATWNSITAIRTIYQVYKYL